MRVVNDEYAVFFDTNTIKGKYWLDHTVRQKAVTIRDDTIIKIDLYLPEVVQKEWSRYYARHAKEQFDKIVDVSERLVDMSFDAIVTEGFDHEKVDKNSKKVLKELGFTLVPTPHDAIDYKELVELAIKHEPPFSPNDGSDKGLKDAIIAHTIKYFALNHKGKKLVFIGKDGLMTTYLQSIMPAKSSFTVYDSIEKFAEELMLQNSNLSKELASGATKAFFAQDVKTSFYYTLGLRDLLIKSYRDKVVDAGAAMKHLPHVKVNDDSDVKIPLAGGQWTTDSNKILISDSTFNKKEDVRLSWSVLLDFMQNYSVTMPSSEAIGSPGLYAVKHVVTYRLDWTVELSDTGELVNPLVEGVEELSESQTIKTSNPLGVYSALSELLKLDVNPAISAATAIGNLNTSAISSIASSMKNIPDMSWVKDMPVLKLGVQDLSSQLSAFRTTLTTPTVASAILDTKPPIQGALTPQALKKRIEDGGD